MSSPYILYIRKTDDVLYTYSVYPCVGGVVLGKVGLPYCTPVDGYIPTTLLPLLGDCLVDTWRQVT